MTTTSSAYIPLFCLEIANEKFSAEATQQETLAPPSILEVIYTTFVPVLLLVLALKS